jgi:hypothetical protein
VFTIGLLFLSSFGVCFSTLKEKGEDRGLETSWGEKEI